MPPKQNDFYKNFPQKKIRTLIIATIVLVTVAVSLPVLLEKVISLILYRSTFNNSSQPQNLYANYQSHTYMVGDKKVDLVYRNRGGRDVFVYFHGNVGRLNYILDYLNEHTSFISPAYPGYHRSEGSPSVETSLEMVTGLLPQIEKLFGKGYRLHLIGHSLGSQTASYFALQLWESPGQLSQNFKTLSLVAGFPSIRNQCDRTLGPFAFLCYPANQSFSAQNYLSYLENNAHGDSLPNTQILVYHLPTDKVIPYQDGKKLYQLIGLPERERKEDQKPQRGGGSKRFIDFTSGSHGNFDIARVVSDAIKFSNP